MKRKVFSILSLVALAMLCTMCVEETQTTEVEIDFSFSGAVHVSPDAVAQGDEVTVQIISFSSAYYEETPINEIDYLVDGELKATSSDAHNYGAVIKTEGLPAGKHKVTARVIPKKSTTIMVTEIIPAYFTITE